MPKTRINCPNCRQPIMAEIDQLFDVNIDPSAKQRIMSGAFNYVRCPLCGYQGSIATPIVYHDPEKELLLTFVPAELGLPQPEQERLIGGLINQAISKLPQEKRKGYLLRPQTTLTLQGLIERVLEAEGITREMIQAQQKRLNLLQRLANASDEHALEEILEQEDALIDAEFFTLLQRLVDTAMMSGDQASAKRLADLQKKLLDTTNFGQQVTAQSKEVEAAIADLRAAGENLTREKLLELVIKSPNDTRLGALVSFARPAMDYTFFQLLSDRIERARGDGRARLVELRTKLLEMTQEIDRQLEAHVQEVRKLIQSLLQSSNVEEAMLQNLSRVDDYFVRELQQSLDEARKSGDLEKSGKLNSMMEVIREASAPPPELRLIEEYLDASTDQERREFLEQHREEVTPEFLEMMANLAMQVQAGADAELMQRVSAANRSALRFSMEQKLKSS